MIEKLPYDDRSDHPTLIDLKFDEPQRFRIINSIHAWIQEDAPTGIKMMMTPDLVSQLATRIAKSGA